MNEKLEFNEVEIAGIKRITENAIQVAFSDGQEKWIPRSNISYKDDKDCEGLMFIYEKTEIRVVRWYCEQEGI